MDLPSLFEELKEKFPECFFTCKGRRIVIHEGSYIDGYKAYNYIDFKFPYKLGLHYKLSDYLEKVGWYSDRNKNDEVVIKQF
jgi:hypothetical protein